MMTQTITPAESPSLWKTFVKLQNPLMKWLLSTPLHGVVSRSYMLILVTGRKTGALYTTPVQYYQNGDRLTVVTSHDYRWWRNLEGGADASALLRGKLRRAHAVTSTRPEVIEDALDKLYPKMEAGVREQFVQSKVAITLTLLPEEAG